tara:strand:- start:890 stop:1561 length:672 start_codon:yes stop_codon:yes gene_type:complete
MSWNGTVHCGYCWGKGHNRRTCPKHKEDAEALIAEGDEVSYTVRSYLRRKEKVKRQCSFCTAYVDLYNDDEKMEESYNHNKRTCEHKKNAVASLHKQNKAYRKKVLKYLRKVGLAPGALVACERYGTEQTYFVSDINWHLIFVPDSMVKGYNVGIRPGRQLLCANINDLGRPHYSFDIPRDEKHHPVEKGYYESRLLSPIKSKLTPPKGWVEDIECVESMFET